MSRFLVAALALALFSRTGAAQTTISLNTAARVAPGSPVRLADVASVSGPDTASLSDIVVAADPAAHPSPGAAGVGWFELDLAGVRAALDDHNVNWGRTTLSGSTCAVRFGATPAPAARPDKPARAEPAAQVVDVSGPATIRTYAAVSLARLFAVAASDLRLTFDPKDDTLLSTPVRDRRIDVQPGATNSSAVVPVRILIFSGDRLVSSSTISVRALVLRAVVTAASTIDRRAPITADQITSSQQWLPPSTGISCTIEQAIGATARARITAGRVITADLIQPPIVVKRGELVDVHCLAGYVSITLKARALEDGRDGEEVSFCVEGSKKPFTARMSGSHAVVEIAPDSASTPATPEANR